MRRPVDQAGLPAGGWGGVGGFPRLAFTEGGPFATLSCPGVPHCPAHLRAHPHLRRATLHRSPSPPSPHLRAHRRLCCATVPQSPSPPGPHLRAHLRLRRAGLPLDFLRAHPAHLLLGASPIVSAHVLHLLTHAHAHAGVNIPRGCQRGAGHAR
eukprot:364866-Chlamydomonas_euryale.AAC.10